MPSKINGTLAAIGAFLIEGERAHSHIQKVFENPETGLVVYCTDVYDDQKQPDWRWYTVALPDRYDTTHSAKTGKSPTLLGSLPFKEVIETRDKLILVVSDGHKTVTEEWQLDEMRPYVEEEEQG